MRLVSIDQPESENPNEETSFEIEEEDALTQGGFSNDAHWLVDEKSLSDESNLKTFKSELEKSPQLFAQK